MFEGLIIGWRYLAIGLGTFIEGEAVLIAAGSLCQREILAFPVVLLAGWAGSVAWSQCWFQLGRRLGLRAVERHRSWQARVARVERWVNRHAIIVAIGFRFIAGIGTIAPLFLGATRYSTRRFIVLDSIGAAAWTLVFTGLGFGLAAELRAWLGRTSSSAELLASVFGLLVLGWGVIHLVRRWLARHACRPAE